tara:strand:+ start:1807 stop:2139 length:333 start_codon:yes stop_codon:yes gene_type:complete
MVKKVKTINNKISIFRSDLEKIISLYESAKDRLESIDWIDIKFDTEMKPSDTINISYLTHAEYIIKTSTDFVGSTVDMYYQYKDGVDFDYELHNENLIKETKTYSKSATK